MAVVIRNGRLAEAGTQLPLTQDEIAQELGSRHRAAIGITELSDAITVVVSEETGNINVCQQTKMIRVSVSYLEEYLTRELSLNQSVDNSKQQGKVQ